MSRVEAGSFQRLPKHSFHLPENIRLAYDRIVTHGPLRESLLNVSSYRPRINEGTDPLTRSDVRWAIIAVGSSLAFGIAAAQFLGRIL